ncbi:uncharacterized protein [Rutidosis leptorrhynchoides]|uniref:uncharacterized protein n=1 Tax=Rutidosis leptorrhynchoides TaxID=125765 RepID=UPI003A99A970
MTSLLPSSSTIKYVSVFLNLQNGKRNKGKLWHKAEALKQDQKAKKKYYDQEDEWKWQLATNGRFTVNGLFKLLEDQEASTISGVTETLRNNLIPKKLEIFIWRSILKRLPVKTELDKRGIDLHTVRCPLCDDDMETVEHSLIFCKDTSELWNQIFKWWNLGHFNNLSINELFHGNIPVSTSSFGKKIWQTVEWVCAYYI